MNISSQILSHVPTLLTVHYSTRYPLTFLIFQLLQILISTVIRLPWAIPPISPCALHFLISPAAHTPNPFPPLVDFQILFLPYVMVVSPEAVTLAWIKMDDSSKVPLSVQKWRQTISDTSAWMWIWIMEVAAHLLIGGGRWGDEPSVCRMGGWTHSEDTWREGEEWLQVKGNTWSCVNFFRL